MSRTMDGTWNPGAVFLFPNQVENLIPSQAGCGPRTFQRSVRQCSFPVLKCKDSFLHRIRGDDFVNKNRSLLTNSMGTVGGLIFHRRIPPRVHEKHMVRLSERQTRPPCFLGEQQDRRSVLGLNCR